MNKRPQTLIFATSNEHKLSEIQDLLVDLPVKLRSLKDISWNTEIEETGSTLEENSMIKARTIYDALGESVFAEDTGLEVYALNMKPGVHTARYAGPQKNAVDNMNKLLHSLENQNDRRARFRTVLTLIFGGKEYIYEGICDGVIEKTMMGKGGFGYDPIFKPDGYDKTFGELADSIKNSISHRSRAIYKMISALRNNNIL